MSTVQSRRPGEVRMQSFIVPDYLDRPEQAINALAEWLITGKIAWREGVQEGFENLPANLQRLFSGANQGKQLLILADPGKLYTGQAVDNSGDRHYFGARKHSITNSHRVQTADTQAGFKINKSISYVFFKAFFDARMQKTL
jgi:hypothetical protein